MNERFFDLTKSKQDRIINGALSVFAENGYSHASTDEITGRAGISKGLLFHYFGSKLGTYTFLYDYSTRYILLVLKNEFKGREKDFYRLQRRLAQAEAMILRTYPCMLLFASLAELESDPAVLEALKPLRGQVAQAYQELYDQAAVPAGLLAEDAARLCRMLAYSKSGIMQRALKSGSSKEQYLETLLSFIDTLEKRN